MRIIVIGAGEVGSYVAERLSGEHHDITLVERDRRRTAQLDGSFDALVLTGDGNDPDTLTTAGAASADLVVAVTSNDDTNIVAAMLAKHLGTTRSVVRIENARLRDVITGGMSSTVGADIVIDPDEETSAEIIELIDNPGTVEVESMAGGEIVVLGVRLAGHAPVVGHTLEELAEAYSPNWQFLFGAITRGDETVIPRGNHRLEAGDLVRVVCTRQARTQLSALVGLPQSRARRVVLLGGGRTAELIARQLVTRIPNVAVVERDHARAVELAERLDGVEVINGDITDAELLDQIQIGSSDLVVALTGDDDANILACLYAKSAGVTETITIAHRLSFLPLLAEIGIDGAPSPRTATANAVLRVARGRVAAVATFLRGDVEVLEIEIDHDSRAANKTIAQLHLPKEALIGAVLSEAGAEIGRGSTTLHPNDRVILLAKPAALPAARRILG